jgi:hypothetical protein
MSRLVIVGGSSGIGRDIGPYMQASGHTVELAKRDDNVFVAEAFLLCQRFRGDGDDWYGEFMASLTRTKQWVEYQGYGGRPCSIVVMASVAGVSVEEEHVRWRHRLALALGARSTCRHQPAWDSGDAEKASNGMTQDEYDAEWLHWANHVFCGDSHRSAHSGPSGGFSSVEELRAFLAARLDRRTRHAEYERDVHA